MSAQVLINTAQLPTIREHATPPASPHPSIVRWQPAFTLAAIAVYSENSAPFKNADGHASVEVSGPDQTELK